MTRQGGERQVQDMGHGDHLCLAFADDAEQRRVVTAYLAAGLQRGERVLYFADLNEPGQVLGWLEAAGADPGAALGRGQLTVTTADDSYLAAGSFDADTMVATLQQEVHDALAAGWNGLRVSGEMGWALRGVPGAEQLGAYETKVNAVFAGRPALAICQYDARRFGTAQLHEFDRRHPGAVELDALYSDAALRLVPAFRAGQRALRVVGTVDYRTTEALAGVLETVLGWPGDVWVDMSALEFIDLAGMRALARAAERLPAGRRMHVVELAPMLCQVVSVIGWDEHPSLTVSAGEGPA
ncbi:STAS domain-containing protein [Streptacidiphilus sp. PB12-B1b]|uniref:MEDS domain-containing protein n=1 Tax=Streptacidiphilus sp. PB12-B1b TaxID=2705012 RepID=UPI0015FC3DA2|nr:MEDS domain-containing protein [Streptacidiphilus sp. PB12-B1b]QMU77176.1 STAS domain-containing protein [Streptacidiphilus sp. PB12-B1b]